MGKVTNWEFPWVIVDEHDIRCTRCGTHGDIKDWMEFLEQHKRCQHPLLRMNQPAS